MHQALMSLLAGYRYEREMRVKRSLSKAEKVSPVKPHASTPEALHPAAPTRQAVRKVLIEGFEVLGSIGVYDHERRARQPLIVSLTLSLHDTYDGQSDQLGDVYDYDTAIAAIRRSVAVEHINLLETLADRIARSCLHDPRVISVIVRIEKPALAKSCRMIGIEIERHR